MVHSLNTLSGVGPKRISILKEAGIFTVEDLVQWAPRNWIDKTKLTRIDQLHAEMEGLVRGEILSVRLLQGRRPRLVARLSDGTGEIELLFFNFLSGWQQRLLPGSQWIASGKVSWFRSPQMVHPELDEVKPGEKWEGGILPVYPLTEKMRSARMEQRFMHNAMKQALSFPAVRLTEKLPETLRSEFGFLSELENFRRLHLPQNMEDVKNGLRQLRWGELLPVAIRMARRRKLMQQRGKAQTGGGALAAEVKELLPFKLTAGQESALKTILGGIESPQQSHFLLQGDVGSGKTAVALLAAVAVIGAGSQVALMAPTEILIWQHFKKLLPICKAAGIRSAILTGSTSPAGRREVLAALERGEIQLLFGTHTLFSADVRFDNLGFCIIDEQHRFGVGQRAALLAKGGDPDLLALSATPIPRSLAMTLYGDLQPVQLSEKPIGRQPIQTRLVPQKKRPEMLEWLDQQFENGARAYWVVPRIEEENSDGDNSEGEKRSLEALAAQLRRLRPQWKMRVVHGRLPEEEKLSALEEFASGRVQLLVATTVIEVGVDVPEATIMVIDGGDRFGLAQLHQLRGRVGRSDQESWCFLLVDELQTAHDRLKGFVATEDGFAIAELDLEQRGAGNLEGLTQSGATNFRWFDFVRDRDLIQQSAQYAANRMAQWETLPEEEKKFFLEWAAEDHLETATNQ